MGRHVLWDPIEDNIVKEIDDAGGAIADYTTEPYLYGELISQHRGGQSSFYHFDGQGSTTSLTDSAANIADTYAYSAFGEVTQRTGNTDNSFQYIGRNGYYTFTNRGESSVRARVLSHSYGSWRSPDPIESITSISRYVYSSNSPLKYIDPSGWISVTVDQRPNERVLKPCGGYRARLWYTVPRRKAPADDSLYIIQHICVFNGSTSDCVFGAPPEYSCACSAFQTRNCKPCCYLEELGEAVYDAAKGAFEPIFDINNQPRYSTYTGCVSKGALTIRATVRAFRVNLEMLRDILKWPAGLETCNSDCAPPTTVELGPHIVLGDKDPPKWFSSPAALRDEIKVETKTTWDCCNAIPNNQSVVLPTGEEWEWKEGMM